MRWKVFGRLLDSARERAVLTQEQLAELLSEATGAEIRQQSINQWCRGQYRPGDRRTLVALCYVLLQAGGLPSLHEVNELLQAANQGALHSEEIEEWFTEKRQRVSSPTRATHPIEEVSGREEDEAREQKEERNQVVEDETEWFHAVPIWMSNIVASLSSPQRLQASLVIALATIVIAETWQELPEEQTLLKVVWRIGGMWGSVLLLTWPQSREEAKPSTTSFWIHKLFRLSGVACGIALLMCLLLVTDALSLLVIGAPLWRQMVYLLSGLGAFVAYGSGLSVQHAFHKQMQRGEGRFYSHSAAQVTVGVLVGQGVMVWFSPVLYLQFNERFLVPLLVLILLGVALWQAQRGIGRT